MNQIRNITVVAASVALLRAAAAGSAGDVAACQTEPDLWRAFTYDAASTTTDDGMYVIKPDSVGAGSPGRWILRATLESSGVQEVKVVLGLAWNGTRAVALLDEGWTLIGADGTKIYVSKTLSLS